jgi:enterochelin esterase-like enzyme
MRSAILIAGFALSSVVWGAEPDAAWRSGASPRMDKLQKLVGRGNSGAVPQFWEEIRTHGAPLVEAIPGDPKHVLLTFLYKAQTPAASVGLMSMLAVGTNSLQHELTHIVKTDVWYRTYWIRNDMRFSYSFAPKAIVTTDGNGNSQQQDVLNPKSSPVGTNLGNSIVELPAAPPQSSIVPRPGVPAGNVVEEHIVSKILKSERRAWVYTPAGYDQKRAAPYPVLICFDGWVYTQPDRVPTPTILDNLIAEKQIPPMLAVFIDQSPQPQRNIELSNNQPFLDFVADELLPQVRQRWRATTDPAKTVVCGSSAGGLASLFFAFRRPDVFGNVLAQSAALWPGATRDNPVHEWLIHQYEGSPRLPIRFVLQVGMLETGTTPLNGPSILSSNRRLRDVLAAKRYELHYHEIASGHEALNWRGGVGDGLVELMGNSR